jgi:hypothetical protein
VPVRLLRAELVRVLLVEGAHFRGNAVLAIALPQIVSTPASVERLALLRDGLAGLTALADGRAVTGRVPPVALARAALELVESVAPFESIETVVDVAPEAALVGDDSDLALLLALVVLVDVRRRLRELGRSGKVHIGLAGEPGGAGLTVDADGEFGSTPFTQLYELAEAAAPLCGAALRPRGEGLVPVLCFSGSERG